MPCTFKFSSPFIESQYNLKQMIKHVLDISILFSLLAELRRNIRTTVAASGYSVLNQTNLC